MMRSRLNAIVCLAVLLTAAPVLRAQQTQQRVPHIGYIYPAGGRVGTTFQVTVGGQFLEGVSGVQLFGAGVKATVIEHYKPLTAPQAILLRDQLQELQEKRQAATSRPVRRDPQSASRPSTKPIWTADDEKTLADIRKKLMTFVPRPSSPAIAETVTVEITIDQNAEPGKRELRLIIPGRLTNPLTMFVGELPEFSEEPARNVGEATKSVAKNEMSITLPAVVNGQIMPGGVDQYHFRARRGQHLVIIASARELIPYLPDAVPGWFQATLTLSDTDGRELAYDDDYRFSPDPVLHYLIARDGQYTIEIKDSIYRGREDFVYRIAIGELPFVTSVFPLGARTGTQTAIELKGWNLPRFTLTHDATEEMPGIYPLTLRKNAVTSNLIPFAIDDLPEINEQKPATQPGTQPAVALPAVAQPIVLPEIINGRINKPGESDVFSFAGQAGQKIVAEVDARRLNSPLDSVLKLTDSSNTQLAFNDDHEDKGTGLLTHHADSWLSATLPADGTYCLRIADAQRQGGPEYAYRLRISAPRPDFELRIAPSSLSVLRGSAPLVVYALRRDGFTGEILLSLKDAPSGFKISPDRVPANEEQVKVTLSAPRSEMDAPVSLHLEGRATIDGKEIIRPVIPAEDMMQAFAYRQLVPAQELMAITGTPGFRLAEGRFRNPGAATQSVSDKGKRNAK